MDCCIKGGFLVDPVNNREGRYDILIKNGSIHAVEREIDCGELPILAADGYHILHGLVDLHTHLREPGREDKETILTGSKAAVAGGFTTIAAMPNTQPAIDNAYGVTYIREKAAQANLCKVLPIGCLTKGQAGEEMAELGEMVAAGAVAFSNDGVPLTNAEVMRCAMEYSKLFDLPIAIHAEDKELAAGGQMHLGKWSTIIGLKGIPSAAEEVIVARDLILAENTGARIHLCHLSSARSVALVREAKSRGVRVTAEVTPHHLALTDEDVASFDTHTKVNPPLTSEKHRDALIEGLLDGTIDAIATDHAPHTREEKHQEYNHAPFGMIGLESALSIILTTLYHSGKMTLNQLVEWMSENPRRILKLPQGVTPGAPADLVFVDLDTEYEFTKENIYSKSKNSPFIGKRFKGATALTMVDGEVKFHMVK